MKDLKSKTAGIPFTNYLLSLAKWLLLAIPVGFLVGSASAFFLESLNWVTNYRESHVWIIALLPLGGLIIGVTYHFYGESVVKGNNLMLEELHTPKQIIPFRMAPLVLFGTLVTHLFGGSAGREGTAVQMGGAIADQFTKWFKLNEANRKIIIIMGISAGFASVFGTPLAGAIFAVEIMMIGRLRYQAIVPSLVVAYIADYSCKLWNVAHTHYSIASVPDFTFTGFGYTLFCGVLFGLAALLFSKTVHFFTAQFKKYIAYPPLRPVIGGIVIALAVWAMGTTKYIGLGVPTIVDSFSVQQPYYAFLVKLLLTTFTLGAGFKGGEVTPLFFVGATLGSALFLIVPLPMALLAGMGFVAIFSGATNTPIACTLMGIELFGAEAALYLGIACGIAYLFSGHTGIYSSQIQGGVKQLLYEKFSNKKLNDL
ncbi:voltage-gated chloride channel family protein [Flavobacterium psychrotrophum]|uniref:voltage-gated chloride channel family protein n=1 Tax=Flavobacterium psychrotrophum TaxID=2294119 RepID=UPI001968F4ED|nr:voltage-gated chloride channel family protein [Flavobacterium psychrotrophum]